MSGDLPGACFGGLRPRDVRTDACDAPAGAAILSTEPHDAARGLRQLHTHRATPPADGRGDDRQHPMLEPTTNEKPEPRPHRGIRAVRLGDEGHDPKAPGPHLMAKGTVLAPVAMEDQTSRLDHDGLTRANEAVEHVEIATAGQGRARVERLVEAPERGEDIPADCHVAAGAEDPGRARVYRIARQAGPVADLRKAVTEAAVFLEKNLHRREELGGKNRPADRRHVGMLGVRLEESGEPPRVHGDIVVEVGDEFSPSLAPGAIPREVEATVWLPHVADAGKSVHESRRAVVAGGVVHHQDIELHAAMERVAPERLQRTQARLEELGPVMRADGDRQRGVTRQ